MTTRYIVLSRTRYSSSCWTGTENEILEYCNHHAGRLGTVVYEETSAAALADGCGLSPAATESEFAEADAGMVLSYGRQYGWDARLYRADYLREEGIYSPEPVNPIEACEAFLRAGMVDFEMLPIEAARERHEELRHRFSGCADLIDIELG